MHSANKLAKLWIKSIIKSPARNHNVAQRIVSRRYRRLTIFGLTAALRNTEDLNPRVPLPLPSSVIYLTVCQSV